MPLMCLRCSGDDPSRVSCALLDPSHALPPRCRALPVLRMHHAPRPCRILAHAVPGVHLS